MNRCNPAIDVWATLELDTRPNRNAQDAFGDYILTHRQQIRTAFSKKIMKVHTDKHPNLSEQDRAKATQKSQHIIEAKNILTNEDEDKSRAYWDCYRTVVRQDAQFEFPAQLLTLLTFLSLIGRVGGRGQRRGLVQRVLQGATTSLYLAPVIQSVDLLSSTSGEPPPLGTALAIAYTTVKNAIVNGMQGIADIFNEAATVFAANKTLSSIPNPREAFQTVYSKHIRPRLVAATPAQMAVATILVVLLSYNRRRALSAVL